MSIRLLFLVIRVLVEGDVHVLLGTQYPSLSSKGSRDDFGYW